MALLLVIEGGIRIGNEKYEYENNSFGSTTLQSRHITVNKDTVKVNFIGKKGVRNEGKIRNKKLSKNLRNKKKTLNKNDHVFTYRRKNCWYKLKSSDVNNYLKKFGNFTSKNFRTLMANINLISLLLKYNKQGNKNKFLNNSIEKVSDKMNNTKTICKNSYIDPLIINLFLNDTNLFMKSFHNSNSKEDINDNYVKLLKKYQ